MKTLHIVSAIALAASLGACKKDEGAGEPEQAAETDEAPTPEPTTPPEEPTEAEAPVVAEAQLQSAEGKNVSGAITFTELEDGKVRVEARVEGLTPGEHGFHVHETGDCSAPDFQSAGGHFAPKEQKHGGPDDAEHHAGDFGNITAGDDGTATASWEVDYVSLEEGQEEAVLGRAVVVHEGKDDLESQPSGDAGGRVACGVIELK